MKQILYGFFLCAGLVVLGYAVHTLAAPEFIPNPLFDPLPVGKDGLLSVPYTQEQKDMTMLYGRLDYIVQQLNQLQAECGKR